MPTCNIYFHRARIITKKLHNKGHIQHNLDQIAETFACPHANLGNGILIQNGENP